MSRPSAAARTPSAAARPGTVAVLLNPGAWSARRTGIDLLERRVRAACASAGLDAVVRLVPPAGLEAALRAQVADGAERVVVGGGDGTVRTAAQVLAGGAVALGILPLGRLNHGARDLGLAVDLEEAVATVAHGRVRRIDLGDLDGRVFVNNSALGVYPHLVRVRREHERLGWASSWAWLRALGRTLWRFPVLDLAVRRPAEVGRLRSPLVFVGNNEYALGPRLGRRAALDEGVLWLCAVRETGRLGFLRLLVRSLLFTVPHPRHLVCARVEDVMIDLGRRSAWVSLDGEVERVRGRLGYSVRPRALAVLVPPEPEPRP